MEKLNNELDMTLQILSAEYELIRTDIDKKLVLTDKMSEQVIEDSEGAIWRVIVENKKPVQYLLKMDVGYENPDISEADKVMHELEKNIQKIEVNPLTMEEVGEYLSKKTAKNLMKLVGLE